MTRTLVVLGLSLVLAVAACGGDDDSADGGSSEGPQLSANDCIDEMIDLLDEVTIEEIESPDFEDDERTTRLENRCEVLDELTPEEENELFSRVLAEVDPAKVEALGRSAETTFEETGDSIN